MNYLELINHDTLGLPGMRCRDITPIFAAERGHAFELGRGTLEPGQRVLMVDDWIHSGWHITAALELVERQGATVVGIAALNLNENEVTRPLLARYLVRTMMRGGNTLQHGGEPLSLNVEVTP